MLIICHECRETYIYKIIPRCPYCGTHQYCKAIPSKVKKVTITERPSETITEIEYEITKPVLQKKKKSRKGKYNSIKLREWSTKVRERDNHTCQKCGNVGMFAHHIKPKKQYPELAYDIENGITLCNVCHGIEHNCCFDTNGAFSKRT